MNKDAFLPLFLGGGQLGLVVTSPEGEREREKGERRRRRQIAAMLINGNHEEEENYRNLFLAGRVEHTAMFRK